MDFETAAITFMDQCLGGSDWSRGRNGYDWRRYVANWWGITPGDVNARVKDGLERVEQWLISPKNRGY